jgi:type I restriction enzyme R subunit
MNEALAIYSEKNSANLSTETMALQNIDEGLVAPPFEKVFASVKAYVDELRLLTDGFTSLPPSE